MQQSGISVLQVVKLGHAVGVGDMLVLDGVMQPLACARRLELAWHQEQHCRPLRPHVSRSIGARYSRVLP
jgi:hypothetical protein